MSARCEEIDNRLIMRKVHFNRVGAQCGKTQKHKCKSEDKLTERLGAVVFHKSEHNAHGKQRIDNACHIELEAEDCHQPARDSGSDVGTHNNSDGLRQRQQASVYKTYGEHGCCS